MATELGRVTTPPFGNDTPVNMYQPPVSPVPYLQFSPSPHNYALPLTPPPILPFVDNGRVWLPSSSPVPFIPPFHPPYQSAQSYAALNAPCISPVRPSSAEPALSSPYFAGPTYPPPSVGHPLPTFAGGISHATREEGKGERASRITHHLRLSSRARSVSPQSHRYIAPGTSNAPLQNVENAPPRAVAFHQGLSSIAVVSGSPNLRHTRSFDNTNLSPAMGNVMSPRPMHSPKHTVTVDPFTHATFNKSERVEVLERMAAETVASNADMSKSVPDLLLEMDKTLPNPPVPSGKPTRADGRPKADMLFSPTVDDDYAPPTPTLAAFSSPKASRAALGQLSGLDALEAKLLAEVGTRKVIQDKRPSVRTIMPIAIPRPGAVPDPAVDSAISSLSLPAIGADEGTLRFEQESHSGAASDRNVGERSNQRAANDVVREPVLQMGPPNERARKKSTPKPRADDMKEKEQHRLRKAAQGRVAAWLGSIEPDVPPLTTTPPRSPLPAKSDIEVQSRQATDTVPVTPSDPNVDPHATIKAAGVVETRHDDMPNPRSSGFMPLDTTQMQRQNIQSTTAVSTSEDKTGLAIDNEGKIVNGKVHANRTLTRPANSDAPYDIRSARGGRGGIVTAVAAIWGSASQSVCDSTPGPNLGVRPLKQAVPSPRLKDKTSPPQAKSAGWVPLPPQCEAPTPAANLSTKRANLIKSSSIPAILSSSLATPILSSTASLARPVPVSNKTKTSLPPVLPASRSGLEAKLVPTPKPPSDLAFGQARLRELIRKYQG